MADMVRITKIYNFEMAHALLGYDGDCRNIHGHSYSLHVTLCGKIKQEDGHPKNGMLIDFKDLKRIIKTHIIDTFDHALVLNERVESSLAEGLNKHYEKLVLTKFQPTCENLLLHFVKLIENEFPTEIELFALKLYETQTSFAEWYRSENMTANHS